MQIGDRVKEAAEMEGRVFAIMSAVYGNSSGVGINTQCTEGMTCLV